MKRIRPLVVSLVMIAVLVSIVLVNWFVFEVRPVLGLDLQGGIQVVLKAPDGTPPDVMNRALENIRNRVDALGVGEPSLSVIGTQILVQLPSLAQGTVVPEGKQWCVTSGSGKDLGCFPTDAEAQAALQQTGQDRLIQLIGQTARLEQRAVIASIGADSPDWDKKEWKVTCGPTSAATPTPAVKTPPAGKTKAETASPGPKAEPTPKGLATPTPTVPPSPVVRPTPPPSTAAALLTPECQFDALKNKPVVFFSSDGQSKYQLGKAEITGDMIAKATAVYRSPSQSDPTITPGWIIQFNLTSDGSKKFAEVTKRLSPEQNSGTGQQLAIVVDQRVISAPTVQGEITGSGEITLGGGGNVEREAKDLATQLNAGALPVQLAQSNVETVSATLGKTSLHQGLLAGLVGLIALALYLLFYYRLLGLVTWMGMAIWGTLALGLVSIAGRWFGYSLTLAGVAGLIVSLGITTDSYIVFYERLKDDVRHGKTPRAAVQPAFKRAWRTIVAADIVTILAAAVLYIVAVSSVRGFALTLGLATMLDMFVVYFFKRPTVFLIARSSRLTDLRGFGLTSGVAADAPAPRTVN